MADPAAAEAAPSSSTAGLPAAVQSALADMDAQVQPASPAAEPSGNAAETATEQAPSGATDAAQEAESGGNGKRSLSALLEAGELVLDDVLKDPKISGHIGALAQKQSKDLLSKADEDKVTAERYAEKLEIALRDPENPLFRDFLDKHQNQAMLELAVPAAAAAMQQAYSGLIDDLPESAQKVYAETLKGKTYEGGVVDGQRAFLKDLLALVVKDAQQRWNKEERPALRKEILAEINGGEPTLDRDTGGAPAKSLTLKQLDDMDWRQAEKLAKEAGGFHKLAARLAA